MNIEVCSTFCRVCESSCALVAEKENETILRLLPDKSHPVSKGFCCPKGIFYLDIHQDQDRLNTPLKRTNSRFEEPGKFEKISWVRSMDEIAGRLGLIIEQHGQSAVSIYSGNPDAFNSKIPAAARSFTRKIGITRLFNAGSQDCTNKFAASEAVFDTSMLHPLPDIDHTDYLLVIGENPKVSHMSFINIANPMAKLSAAEKRGARIVYVNPRKIESADSTGRVVQIKPDTDLYFLAALLFEVERIGGFRQDLIKAHGKHTADLKRFIENYPPERVENVVGISNRQICRIAREFVQAEKAAVHMSTGVNMGRGGTLAYWLVQMLSFVTGNLDKKGGNIYKGGPLSNVKAGKVRPGNPFFDSPYGPLRTIMGRLPGNLMADMIDSEIDPIRALIVITGNPVLSIGGEEKMRNAFKKLDLLVVMDIYRNATGEMADYLLPCADMLERSDLNTLHLSWGGQHQPFVQYTDPVVPPRFERKEHWWILSRLEQAMGFESVLDDPSYDPNQGIDQMLSAADLTIDQLKNLPCRTALLDSPKSGRFFSDCIQTDDQKLDCCPPIFSDAIQKAENLFQDLDKEPRDQLKLITLRNHFMQNSWYQNLERFKKGAYRSNPLFLNPADARKRGLESGTSVRISNEWGSIEAEIAMDERLREGVVAMTHGWGNRKTPGMKIAHQFPGVNVNRLLPTGPGSYESISNQAHMTGIPVKVEKLPGYKTVFNGSESAIGEIT